MTKRLGDIALKGQRVLIREDLNVPIKDGEVANDARIRAALPSLRQCIAAGAKTLVLSHLGRPSEGQAEAQYSLAPVAKALSEALSQPVRLISDWLDGIDLAEGEIALAENVRFQTGEKANDTELAKAHGCSMRCVCNGCLRYRSSRPSVNCRP